MSNTLKFGNGEWYGKEGTILAYNSENNNYKPLPFTFDRDSVATRVNKQGLIETVGADQPRIDYLNDSNGALLLEPQSTNINPDGGVYNWSKSDASLSTEVQLISPSGNLESVGLVIPKSTGSSTFRGFSRVISGLTSGDLYQYSVFVKKKDARYCMLKLRNTGNDVAFDLDTKQIVGNSNISQGFSFEEYSNGWIRLVLGCNVAADGRIYMGIGCSQALPSGGNDFTGADGSSGMYCTFAQLEAGSYATSYIPTQGSAVTRLADTCNNSGNDQVINSSEGVFYFEGSALDDDGTDRKITLSDGSLNNAINFGFSRFSGNINAEVKSGGVLQTSGFGATGIAQDNNNKFALSWGGGVSKFYVNGTLASSYTSVTSPIGMNVLNFSLSSGFQKSYLNCKDIRVYNTALSDSELQALTS